MESWPKVKLGSHYVPLLGVIYYIILVFKTAF